MADIIQLLPDNIANQIAAGEVIQRPASVVKEMMENAIDAGATEIKVIIKDAGKTLVQIIDNGKGMSPTDARMSFERHATSKIRVVEDLFSIRTMGFRGEALASIAAIARVELVTKRAEDKTATHIVIEGSEVKLQDQVQGVNGTNISVKNLFYNVPARRKFLKSDPVELKHINQEFLNIAIAHPDIKFNLHHNGNELYRLYDGNLKARLVNIFGKNYNEKIIPVAQESSDFKINGFIGKAESAKRTKGEQYFFVNNRYIKSPYLNHAVRLAYDQLILPDSHPFYVLMIDINPSRIDINVHPTKTEIKFDEERLLYNFLKVAIKQALGQYILPELDFGSNVNFGHDKDRFNPLITQKANPTFNKEMSQLQKDNFKNWELMYKDMSNEKLDMETQPTTLESKIQYFDDASNQEVLSNRDPFQMHGRYIISQIRSGLIIIDQSAAHERIIYEKNLKLLEDKVPSIQKELFAVTVELENSKALILKDMLPYFKRYGFEIESFGGNTFIINGLPTNLELSTSLEVFIDELIDTYSDNRELQLGIEQNIARSIAVSASIRSGKILDVREMKQLINQLFACQDPYMSPSGKKCIVSIDLEEINRKFKN
ncbi:MAG TPA: DNA mismatch repair endonuclease MutL [Saprospiraceae bacterium]|nr:DNA mismatch repair endonuclease MutL [Saprospiraceae bacterium]